MKKCVKRFWVNYQFNWLHGVEISKIRQDLDALEKLGATYIDINSSISYDSVETEMDAYCERIETDEEFIQRIEQEKEREEEVRRREFELLEKLKLKYDK